MKPALERIPHWLTTSLQGLVFWIGYKRSLYKDYPLSEGALVTELRSLIHANLPDELFLKCEVGYSKLCKGLARPAPIAGRTRADFVVASKVESDNSPKGWKYIPQYVCELKRSEAPARLIDQDIKQLAAFQSVRPGARSFLIVLSETTRHDRFVTEKGTTRVATHAVPGFAGTYSVRRTLKAASAYTNRDIANYGTIVEVRA